MLQYLILPRLNLGLSGDCTEPSVPPSLSILLCYIMSTFVVSISRSRTFATVTSVLTGTLWLILNPISDQTPF